MSTTDDVTQQASVGFRLLPRKKFECLRIGRKHPDIAIEQQYRVIHSINPKCLCYMREGLLAGIPVEI
jgi:hypothetical protein